MDNVKVRLSITLPGSVMYSKQECFKQLKKTHKNKNGHKVTKTVEEPIPEMFDFHSFKLKDSKTGKVTTYQYKTPKCRPALKVINITTEAYVEMTKGECPSWVKPKVWQTMKPKERLENHLKRIAEHNGGQVLDYQVLDD